MVDATDLVLSKFCIPAIGFNQCLHSTRYTVNQTIKHFPPQCPTIPPSISSWVSAELYEEVHKGLRCPDIACEVPFWAMPTGSRSGSYRGNLAAIPSPQIHVQLSLHQKRLRFFGHMRPSIVLLECNIIYAIAGQCIEVWEEVIAEDVNIHVAIDCIINECNWTQFIANKISPNHLWDIIS